MFDVGVCRLNVDSVLVGSGRVAGFFDLSSFMSQSRQMSDFLRAHTAHEVRLRALAFSLVPNWADAEEVLQEANIVLWQKFDQFKPGTNFIAWSSQVLRLTAKDFLARQRRAKVTFSDEFYDVVAAEGSDAAEEFAERERALHYCIHKLNSRQQKILQMRYFQTKTISAVAEAIGSTNKAVYHALEHIHKALLNCVTARLRGVQSK